LDNTSFSFAPSAFKHGVDEESALNAISNPIYSRLEVERSVMFQTGFDGRGTLIEVAYDTEKRVIFHAMPIRRPIKRIK
jgi:hypothetical protein